MMHLHTEQRTYSRVEIDHIETLSRERRHPNVTSGCPWTPFSLCEDLIVKLPTIYGKILVIANMEFALVLRTKYNVDPTNITFVALCNYSHQWATDASTKILLNGMEVLDGSTNSFLEMEFKMKFDAVIGNPPYQNGTDKNFYKKFITKSRTLSDNVLLIVPSAHFNRTSSLSDLAMYQFLNNPFKGVQLVMSAFLLTKGSTKVKCIGQDGTAIDVLHKDMSSMPGLDVESWYTCLSMSAKDGKGYEIETTGKLKKREAVDFAGNDITCILSPGARDKDFVTCKVDKQYEELIGGLGKHKVVFGADYIPGKIGPVKYAGPDLGCSARAYYIEASCYAEAQRIIEHLTSEDVNNFIKYTKTLTAKNSKRVFSTIQDCRK